MRAVRAGTPGSDSKRLITVRIRVHEPAEFAAGRDGSDLPALLLADQPAQQRGGRAAPGRRLPRRAARPHQQVRGRPVVRFGRRRSYPVRGPGDLPDDEILRDAVLAREEWQALHDHGRGRDVREWMALLDRAARAKGRRAKRQFADVQEHVRRLARSRCPPDPQTQVDVLIGLSPQL